MARGIDYSKWNVIEDEPDSLETTVSPLTRSEKLGGLKLDADGLFATAEKSKDPHDYRVALNQGYRIILAEIRRAFVTNPSMTDQLRIFETSCKLNSSCCHLKLSDWNMTIEVCSEIILDRHSICSQIQLVRARYFRSYAYYQLASEESFDLAESDANSMKVILSTAQSIDRQSAADYANHFQTLQRERQRLHREDCAIGFESIMHRRKSSHSRKGWSLYINRKFALSSAWFASQLLDMTDACKADPSKGDILYDLYNGYGKSQSALSNHKEAAKAFLTAALYSVSSEVKIGLHLQAAALCYISGEYDRSSASYATALLMIEDHEKVSALDPEKSHKPLVKAIANAGLGLCYCKFKEYSRAVEHLKSAIGLFTDDMFITHKITPHKKLSMPISMGAMGLMIPDVIENDHDGQASSDLDIDMGKGEKERSLTLAAATTQACHLLNALEALSDSYAALRDWEKAMYTANSAMEVCQALLVSLSITGVSGILGLDSDGAPASRPPELMTAVVSRIKIRDHISLAMQGHFDHLDDGDGLKKQELEAVKESSIAAFHLKHASALFAKGHMMMKILCHDINRSYNDSAIAEDIGSDNGYTFSAMDPSLSIATMHDLMGKKASNGLENASVVDVISSLWKKSAKELEEMGKFSRAFSVYKDLAAMWSNLAQVKPHSEHLFRISKPDEQMHAENDASPLPLSLSVTPNCPVSEPQEVPYSMPSQYINAEEVHRAQAAMKAKDSWAAASIVARALYQSILRGDGNDVIESTVSSSSGGKVDESQEVAMLESQLSAWQEVIQCEYNAGLSALMFNTADAEMHFERAQGSKGAYLDIAGALIDAEKRQMANQIDLSAAASGGDDAKEMICKLKEINSQRWSTYNTLCCDISFHLAYTYILSKKIADAIAEAEMAIGFAKVSSDSKSRMMKCWGILAVGFNAAGQPLEAERALKECNHLRPIAADDEDEYVNRLRAFMDHHAPRRRREVLATLGVADKYGSKDVRTQEPILESASRTTKRPPAESERIMVSSTLPLKPLANGDRAFSNLVIILYICVILVFFMILSICVAFYL